MAGIIFGLALLLWGACGVVLAVGGWLEPQHTALRVYLAAASAISFLVSRLDLLRALC